MAKGGGGGMYYPMPSINNSTSNTSNNIPEWLTNASKYGIGYAQNLLNNPGMGYGGELTAGLNANQNAAGNMFKGMIGSSQPYYRAATNATNAGMQKGIDVNNQTYKEGLKDIGSYMNPYIDNVVNSVQDLGKQNLEQSLTQTGDQAIGAGAFGGSRHGVQEGVATAQVNKDMNAQIGNLKAAGYNQATGLLGQDIANNMQSQALNQQNYNSYLNRKLAGGQQLAGIGAQSRQDRVGDISNLMNWGNQQQQTQQNALSAKYQEWLRQQNLPYQALSAYNSTVQGAPHSTSGNTNTSSIGWTPQQQQNSSPWASALGYGLGGLGMLGTLSNPATAMGRGFGLLGGMFGGNPFPNSYYNAMYGGQH